MKLNIVLSEHVVNPGSYNEVHVERAIGPRRSHRKVFGTTQHCEMRIDYGYSDIPGPYMQRPLIRKNLQEEVFLRVMYKICGPEVLVYRLEEATREELDQYGQEE